MILVPIVIFSALSLVVIFFAVIVLSRRVREARLAQVSQAIVNSRTGKEIWESAHTARWVETLDRAGLLEPLLTRTNLLVLGNQASGRQAVMIYAANRLNSVFKTSRHAAVYVDVQKLVDLSSVYEQVLLETLYRHLIMAPVIWYRAIVQKSHRTVDRRLAKLESLLARQGDWRGSGIDAFAVRGAFYAWLDCLDVQHLSLLLDNLLSLPPDLVPVLLQLLSDTFPRAGRVSLKLGCADEKLQLRRKTERGEIGLQMDHDFVVALDLDEILGSTDLQPSLSDPRQAFLVDCISAQSAELAARVKDQTDLYWDLLFDPPEAWFGLFTGSDLDIEAVGAALHDLLPNIGQDPEKRLQPEAIEHSIERIHAQQVFSEHRSRRQM